MAETSWVIVPNDLRDVINDALDHALVACPDAAVDRDSLYQQLLMYFDIHGTVPSFTIEHKESKKVGMRR